MTVQKLASQCHDMIYHSMRIMAQKPWPPTAISSLKQHEITGCLWEVHPENAYRTVEAIRMTAALGVTEHPLPMETLEALALKVRANQLHGRLWSFLETSIELVHIFCPVFP